MMAIGFLFNDSVTTRNSLVGLDEHQTNVLPVYEMSSVTSMC